MSLAATINYHRGISYRLALVSMAFGARYTILALVQPYLVYYISSLWAAGQRLPLLLRFSFVGHKIARISSGHF
jgi:hypothetical protein